MEVTFLEPEERDPHRVIGIDPGRTNLISGVDVEGRRYRLNKAQYYHESGFNMAQQRRERWRKEIRAEEELLAQFSLKTAFLPWWRGYLEVYAEVYERVWEEKTRSRWAQEDLRVFRKRERCLDRFFSQFRGTILAWGGASFAPTGRGERTGPTTSLLRKARNYAEVEVIDEYNTSKLCAHCESPLKQAQGWRRRWRCGKRSPQPSFQTIRGLQQCCSTECHSHSPHWVSRDLNSALNMLLHFQNPERQERFREKEIGPLPRVRLFDLTVETGC